jgi:transposase
MAIVATDAAPGTPRVRFRAAPWHPDHPERLELDRRLPPDHLARQIDAALDVLDLTAVYDRYGGTGSDPWPPELLLRAALYETRRGQQRPAEWHRAACESEPVRWLMRGCTPARSVWYAFRDRIGPALDELNRQVLALAQRDGLTAASRAALDGTLAAANASRHRLLNEEALDRRADAPAAATAADAQAQEPPARPGWMAATPAGRQAQRRRLEQARGRLTERLARNRGKRACKRQAPEKVVISPSDPEAALGRDKQDVYRPLYNVQILDDLDSPFILAYEVFAQPNDAGTLGPLLGRAQQALGHGLQALLFDTAYTGGADLATAQAAGVTAYGPLPREGKGALLPKSAFTWRAEAQTYVCPQGHRLTYQGSAARKRSGTEAVVLHRYRCPPEHCQGCPLRGRCTANPAAGRTVSRSEHEGLIEALRARMETAEAKELYRLRRQTVELVNADWKAHRQLQRFSGRGLARARCQVGLTVLVHNLVTLRTERPKARASKRSAQPPAAQPP